ncbi:MAG TPA: hypothetical protein VGM03_11930 [Phycisphaerae bacterium]
MPNTIEIATKSVAVSMNIGGVDRVTPPIMGIRRSDAPIWSDYRRAHRKAKAVIARLRDWVQNSHHEARILARHHA